MLKLIFRLQNTSEHFAVVQLLECCMSEPSKVAHLVCHSLIIGMWQANQHVASNNGAKGTCCHVNGLQRMSMQTMWCSDN